jgi:hypothetical protein
MALRTRLQGANSTLLLMLLLSATRVRCFSFSNPSPAPAPAAASTSTQGGFIFSPADASSGGVTLDSSGHLVDTSSTQGLTAAATTSSEGVIQSAKELGLGEPGGCSWTDAATEAHFDLSAMSEARSEGWLVPGTALGETFYTKVCDNLEQACDNSHITGEATTMQFHNANCQAKLGVNSAAEPPEWSLIDPMNPEGGVKVKFRGGDRCATVERQVTVEVKCNRLLSETEPVQGDEPELCSYVLKFQGPDGCPVAEGLGWGWSFTLTFFVACVVYFGGGAFYKQKYGGATGWESVPHYSFWRELPSLVADGVRFTSAKAREAYNNTSEVKQRKYDNI